MDKYYEYSEIEKDREDELFCRLGQIRAQLNVILTTFQNENTSINEIDKRLEIIKHLLAWYVSDENELSWNQRLAELPRLLSMNEKIDLMSTFIICEKYVRKLQQLFIPWKETYTLSDLSKTEMDCVKLKLDFLVDLLTDLNERKAEYPHIILEACEPKAWFME